MLKRVEGVAFNFFTEEDVVRHHLVQRIVRAYDERTKSQQLSLALSKQPQPGEDQPGPAEPLQQ